MLGLDQDIFFGQFVGSAAFAAPYKWIDENGRVVYGDRPPASSARPVGASATGAKGGAGAQSAPRTSSGDARGAADPTAAGVGPTSGPGGAASAALDGPAGSAAAVSGNTSVAGGNASSATAASLPATAPASLKQAATQFPVVLYTGADCAPCTTARDHLIRRGIPFSERRLGSAADVDAFRKLGFAEMTVPAFSVGREKQTGYERGAWDRLLDAAGYPKTSAMPSGWRPAAAEPLVAASGGQGRVIERIVKQERPGSDAPPLPAVPANAPSSIRF